MLFQLEEERKVTENLSKSLELEKRKVESLEQRAKHGAGSSRGSRDGDCGRRRSLVPDNVCDAETRLGQYHDDDDITTNNDDDDVRSEYGAVQTEV